MTPVIPARMTNKPTSQYRDEAVDGSVEAGAVTGGPVFGFFMFGAAEVETLDGTLVDCVATDVTGFNGWTAA